MTLRTRIATTAVILAMFGLTPNPGSASAQTVDDALSGLHERYDDMVSMRASFEQTMTSTFLDDTERLFGEIVLREDAYRIELGSQTIVTDGTYTWVYNREDNQVIISDYEQDESTFSLSQFLSEFDTAYRVDDYEATGGNSRIELIPTDPFSAYSSVTLWISGSVVEKLRIVDVNDAEMYFELTEIEFDPQIPDDTFLFSMPQGVEIVDLRER